MDYSDMNEVMAELKLTRKDMATAMGVPGSTLKEWLSYRRNPTASAVRLAEVLVAINGTRIGFKVIRRL